MLTSRVFFKSSPNKCPQGSGNGGTGHGRPVDAAFPQLLRDVGIRCGHVDALIHHNLLDGSARIPQTFGQHFATATGARQQESVCPAASGASASARSSA